MSGFKKIGMNSLWMLMGFLFRIGSAFITSVFVARYLGPELYGEMNYVFSFVILFSMFTGTCFDQFLRREFVNHPEMTGENVGTALTLKLIGSLLAVLLVFLIGVLPEDGGQRWLLGIYSVSLVFMVSSIGQILLECHLHSKYIAYSEFIQVAVFFVAKLLFVYQGYPLWTFVALQSFEIGLKALIQFLFIAKLKLCLELRWTRRTAVFLLKESWPYFLTSGAIMIYQRIDQVMLRHMVSSVEVGYYAVAVKICALLAFVPQIISRSVFPSLAKAKAVSEVKFEEQIRGVSSIMFWGMGTIALFITLLVKWPILVIYGESYLSSVPIIRMLVWKNVFSAMGILSGEWILISGLHKLAPVRPLVGAFVNLLLNYYLIPLYLGVGAAFASLISVIISTIIMLVLIKEFRPCLRLLLEGVFMKGRRLKQDV